MALRFKNANLVKFATRWDAIQQWRGLSRWEFNEPIPGFLEWGREPDRPIRNVIYVIWRNPWMTISKGTFVGSMLSMVGFGAYMLFPHVSKRIDSFMNPDGGGNTYQVDKALNSLLEGGWFGRGPGESIAKRFIPDAHADYVFSAAAGEFGLLFCLVLVGLICFIVVRALISAQRQQNLFNRLAASIIAIQFGLQSGINLAVNLNLIPPKGMTLPFVSYGGTSMIAIALGMGLMLAMTRRKPEERMASGLPAYRSGAVAPAE